MALNRQTKIQLANQRVEQISGSTLNLSGDTIISSGASLSIYDNAENGRFVRTDANGKLLVSPIPDVNEFTDGDAITITDDNRPGYFVGLFEAESPDYSFTSPNITINASRFTLHDNPNRTGKSRVYNIPQASLELIDNVVNYIVVDYNGGTPIYRSILDRSLINESDITPVYTIPRTGAFIHVVPWTEVGRGIANATHNSLIEAFRFVRANGLGISVLPTRRASIESGLVIYGANKIELNQATSGDAGVVMFEFVETSTGWTYTTVTQLQNTHYQAQLVRLN